MMPTLTEDKVNLVSHLATQLVIEDVLDFKNCEMKRKNLIIIYYNIVHILEFDVINKIKIGSITCVSFNP